MALPEIGQNLHELDWQSCRSFFNIIQLGAERRLTQTIIQSLADRLSCLLWGPHFGANSLRSKNHDAYTIFRTIARLRQNPAGRRRLRREYVRAPLSFIRRVYTLSYIQHCTALKSVSSLTKTTKCAPPKSQNPPHDMLSGASAAH